MFIYTRQKKEKGVDIAYKVTEVQESESHGAVVSASLKRSTGCYLKVVPSPHIPY